MNHEQLPDEIRKVALNLDNAIESGDKEAILFYFADDCQIEFLGVQLTGKQGVKRWLDWLYEHASNIAFTPVTIMVDGNTFFEEFDISVKTHDGTEIKSRQAEVLEYEDYKVKTLRLYFDRLDFADLVAKGFIDGKLVQRVIKASLKGLV